MNRARVKICGLTRPEDAARAAELGAWACGMILSPVGPRALLTDRARAVRAAIPRGVLAIGVVVPGADDVHGLDDLTSFLALDAIQLHGAASPADLVGVDLPTIQTVHVPSSPSPHEAVYLADAVRAGHGSWATLFDTRVGSRTGGTGQTFGWDVLQDPTLRALVPGGRLILAGGLTAANVGQALDVVRPFAVDVASGVESSPGVKDGDKLARFFEAVHAWERGA